MPLALRVASTIALLVPLLVYGNPAAALLVGAATTLLRDRPLLAGGDAIGSRLLQTAIVLLGFRLAIDEVLALSGDAFPLIAAYVVIVLGVGLLLGRLIGVDRVESVLLASGTAICGGTAIATLAPILGARSEQLGVALGAVFLLNALALLTFPALGGWIGLSQDEFGRFVALAVHDTSSVVATAALYGERAVDVATTIKLGRTLWLIPLAIAASVWMARSRAAVRVPAFVPLFVAASLCGSFLDLPEIVVEAANVASSGLLVAALWFIGTRIDRETVAALRGRVLVHATLLWVVASGGVLAAILALR